MIAHFRLFVAVLAVGCRAPAREAAAPVGVVAQSARVPVVADSAGLAARFSDTARVSVSLRQAREFQLRAPGQRDALRATLRTQRELWRANKPRDYQFLLRVDCFCPGRRGWLLMEVRRAEPLRAWDRAGRAAAIVTWNTFSIDDLFDMLERAVAMDGVVQVAFDPQWHFPADVRTVRLPGPDAWTVIDARGLRAVTSGR